MSRTDRTGRRSGDEQAESPQHEGDRPEVPLQETPEFQAALREAVKDAVPDITAKILEQIGASGAGSAPRGNDVEFASNLALAIASLGDQGVGRKIVAPAVLRARAEARDEMVRLIIDARARDEDPVYHLRNKVFLDEQIIEPIYIDPRSREQCPTEIEWRGVPSEAMLPVNDVAKGIHKAFMDSIGNVETDTWDRPLAGMTAGGLVIRSQSAAVRPAQVMRSHDPAAAPRAGQAATDMGEGLRVKHRERPGQFTERRVLGTVAPPALQTT